MPAYRSKTTMINKFTLINLYRFILGRYNLGFRLDQEIEPNWKVLDVGCGKRCALKPTAKNFWTVGIDHYFPYIQFCRASGAYDAFSLGDARHLPFKSNAFDCLVAIEVLEHMNRKDAFLMLKELERVAAKKIILTTPNGFLPTYAGPDDNPEEAHLSGWKVEELNDLGFDIYGISGLKIFWTIRRGRAVFRFIPDRFRFLQKIIMDISGFFVHKRPKRAFQLLLIKKINPGHG